MKMKICNILGFQQFSLGNLTWEECKMTIYKFHILHRNRSHSCRLDNCLTCPFVFRNYHGKNVHIV